MTTRHRGDDHRFMYEWIWDEHPLLATGDWPDPMIDQNQDRG
jgi:hypothetical protein